MWCDLCWDCFLTSICGVIFAGIVFLPVSVVWSLLGLFSYQYLWCDLCWDCFLTSICGVIFAGGCFLTRICGVIFAGVVFLPVSVVWSLLGLFSYQYLWCDLCWGWFYTCVWSVTLLELFWYTCRVIFAGVVFEPVSMVWSLLGLFSYICRVIFTGLLFVPVSVVWYLLGLFS